MHNRPEVGIFFLSFQKLNSFFNLELVRKRKFKLTFYKHVENTKNGGIKQLKSLDRISNEQDKHNLKSRGRTKTFGSNLVKLSSDSHQEL